MQGFTWGDNPEVFHEILAREVGVAEQQVSQFFPTLGGGDDDSDASADFHAAQDFADDLDALGW